MFGDNLLVGVSQYILDSKRRVFIPANTGREPGEGVYLVYDKELETYTIYGKKGFEVLLKNFKERIIEAEKNEDDDKSKFWKEKFVEFTRACSGPHIIDSQGRICIGNEVIDYEGKINLVGVYDHLVIEIPKKKDKTL